MILEKIKNSDLKYSPQAVLIIENLKGDFPIEAFEKYVKENFSIGGSQVLDFLAKRKEIAENELRKITNLENV